MHPEVSAALPADVPAGRVGAREWELCVALDTAGVQAVPLARAFADILGRRLRLGRGRREAVATSLAEAVGNAVLHGNLGLPAIERRDLDGFAALAEMAARRLAEPGRAGLRIEVRARREGARSFTVEVADEGRGYVPAVAERPGSGLSLIRALADSVELLDGGRRLRMRFGI